MTSALAFGLVKYAGAAYLIYLGIHAFLDKSGALAPAAARGVNASRAFRQAILAEMLNPKTALFFLAFLPQFVRADRGSVVLQFAELGLIFVGMSAIYTTLIALAAGSFGRWLARRRVGRWQGKIVGAIYIGLGVRLVIQER
jgi:threonine/homoserine/homoserine lactone efflux protein